MRVVVLADIHGNVWALDAVLRDLEQRQVDSVVNLGDVFYGPLDPAATADRLLERDWLTIRGNQDRILVAPPVGLRDHPTYRFVAGSLSPSAHSWLHALPEVVESDDRLLVHGTPDADDEPLLEAITPSGVIRRDPASVAHLLTGRSAGLVLCGHSHVPGLLALEDGRLVVNPGSVGLPAYDDDVPFPHAMTSGSPHARYAVLSGGPMGWAVEQIAVPYDHERAARAAERNGRADWAAWLRRGIG